MRSRVEQKIIFKRGIPDEIKICSHGNTSFCNKNMMEVNPTIGCQFQCQYCNAYTQEECNCFSEVYLYEDYPKYLEGYLIEHQGELDKLFFYYSPKIDMLQDCLLESGITLRILELFQKYKVRWFSVTKGKIPPKEIADLIVATRETNQIIISCTMPNERVREIMEPGAATINERLEFAQFCVNNKIPTTAIFSPILPVENLEYIKQYMDYYIGIGIDHFRVDFTEISKESLSKINSLLPEYAKEMNKVYLDQNAEITKWKVPYKNIFMERYWPSVQYMRNSFGMLKEYAKSINPNATVSVCNSLCVPNKLCSFNNEAIKRGFNCIGVRFS